MIRVWSCDFCGEIGPTDLTDWKDCTPGQRARLFHSQIYHARRCNSPLARYIRRLEQLAVKKASSK